MKLLKSAVVAITLALSLGSFSTAAVACEDGRTCFGPMEAINITLGHVAEAMKSLNDGENGPTVEKHIKAAKDSSKEINANDKVDIARSRAVAHLKKAKSVLRKGDRAGATAHLEAAEKGFEKLKGLL